MGEAAHGSDHVTSGKKNTERLAIPSVTLCHLSVFTRSDTAPQVTLLSENPPLYFTAAWMQQATRTRGAGNPLLPPGAWQPYLTCLSQA